LTFDIMIDSSAYSKLEKFVKDIRDREIGGWFLGNFSEDSVFIKKIVRDLHAEESSGIVKISPTTYAELLGANPGLSILGNWHSHIHGLSSYSGIDSVIMEKWVEGLLITDNPIIFPKIYGIACLMGDNLELSFFQPRISINAKFQEIGKDEIPGVDENLLFAFEGRVLELLKNGEEKGLIKEIENDEGLIPVYYGNKEAIQSSWGLWHYSNIKDLTFLEEILMGNYYNKTGSKQFLFCKVLQEKNWIDFNYYLVKMFTSNMPVKIQKIPQENITIKGDRDKIHTIMSMDAETLKEKLFDRIKKMNYNMEKLSETKVLICGLGTVGCELIRLLCLHGIGSLEVVDRDRVEAENTFRQSLYTLGDVGKSKVAAVKEWVGENFPFIEIKADIFEIPNANMPAILLGTNRLVMMFDLEASLRKVEKMIQNVDIVAACVDNFSTRRTLQTISLAMEKPFLNGGVEGTRGSVRVVLPEQDYSCIGCYQRDLKWVRGFPESPDFASKCTVASLSAIEIVSAIMMDAILKIIHKKNGEWILGKASNVYTFDLAGNFNQNTYKKDEECILCNKLVKEYAKLGSSRSLFPFFAKPGSVGFKGPFIPKNQGL